MLPLTYAIRNLFRTPARLLQIVAGSAAVVLLLVTAAALNQGMRRVLSGTGDPRNVILLGAGSEESVERSEVPVNAAEQAGAAIRGLEERLGQTAVSGEVQYQGLVSLPDGGNAQALFRGVTPGALLVHPQVRVLEGRFPGPGEVMVGSAAHHKLRVPPEQLAVGLPLRSGNHEFTIAGTFDAPDTLDGVGDLDGPQRPLVSHPAREPLLRRRPARSAPSPRTSTSSPNNASTSSCRR